MAGGCQLGFEFGQCLLRRLVLKFPPAALECMHRRVKEGLARNILLIEQRPAGSGAGVIINADVLRHLAGVLGKKAHHAVAEDDQPILHLRPDRIFQQIGKRFAKAVRRLSSVTKSVFLEDDLAVDGKRTVCDKEGKFVALVWLAVGGFRELRDEVFA